MTDPETYRLTYPLSLDYTLPFGALAPYAAALAEGRALASQCHGCGHVAFPARSLCGACGDSRMGWTELPGRARIIHRSDGSARSFALVQFEGADTFSTVELVNPEQETPAGRLVAPEGEAPALRLQLEETHGGGANES